MLVFHLSDFKMVLSALCSFRAFCFQVYVAECFFFSCVCLASKPLPIVYQEIDYGRDMVFPSHQQEHSRRISPYYFQKSVLGDYDISGFFLLLFLCWKVGLSFALLEMQDSSPLSYPQFQKRASNSVILYKAKQLEIIMKEDGDGTVSLIFQQKAVLQKVIK